MSDPLQPESSIIVDAVTFGPPKPADGLDALQIGQTNRGTATLSFTCDFYSTPDPEELAKICALFRVPSASDIIGDLAGRSHAVEIVESGDDQDASMILKLSRIDP